MIQKPKADLSTMVIAPMPGMVKSVSAQVGDQVQKSQSCLSLPPWLNSSCFNGVSSLMLVLEITVWTRA